MAGKPKQMSKIKQLIRFLKADKKIKYISKVLGISRNTTRSYIRKIESGSWSLDELLALDDPVLESKLHAGNPAYCDDRFNQLKSDLSYYAKELDQNGVTRKLLWEEYSQKHESGYSYSQFCFHLQQYIRASNPTMVLTHKPGDKVYLDFAGKTMHYFDRLSGEQIDCEILVGCLPSSGFSYVQALPSQQTQDLVYGINCCLQSIGGVPNVLVTDNLKSAVIQANRYEPKLNTCIEDLANHYDTTVVPTRVRRPKDKAQVEFMVRMVYTYVFARLRKKVFTSLEELNEAIFECMKKFNQTRQQDKPYSRQEAFVAHEKDELKPLPTTMFEPIYRCTYKVAQNNHIKLGQDKHYYSVPYQYIGQRIQVEYTRSIVRIFSRTKQIAIHKRAFGQGQYSTKEEHLCSSHQHYLKRSPQYYIERASAYSDLLRALFIRIFEQPKYPEQLYNSCDGILALCKKHKPEIFNKASQIALENEQLSYWFLKKVLDRGTLENLPEDSKSKPLPVHQNIRGKQYYDEQLTLNF